MSMFVRTVVAATAVGFFSLAQSAAQAEEPMVYELRTYYCHPGKLPDLHARFKNHTMKLFEKHGMKNVIYWTPVDEEDVLVYIVAHKSQEAAQESWKAFIDDPEWKTAYAASTENGKLVKKVDKKFLTPTEYSPMK